MVCALRRASDAEISYLLSHPEDIIAFLARAGAEPTKPPPAPGLLTRLFGKKSKQAEALAAPETSLAFSRTAGDETDLDKMWHGIHFLLTGTAWEGTEPLCYLLVGGQQVGEVGHGPARALSSAQVSAFSVALAPLTGENLRVRFNPKAMEAADIYPSGWEDPDEDDEFGGLASYFDDLKAFVTDAAAKNSGIIIYFT
jgi:hypothetical protein